MAYKYVAENSDMCKDLEGRMRKLEENVKFEGTHPSMILVVSNDSIFSKDKYDSSTEIVPETPNKITAIYPYNKAIVGFVNPERISLSVDREIFRISYEPQKKQE